MYWLTWLAVFLVCSAAPADTWLNFYQNDQSLLFRATQPTADGGLIAAGEERTPSSPESILVKLDRLGEIEWQKIVRAGSPLFLDAIYSTVDGGLIALGHFFLEPAHTPTTSVAKLDSQSRVEWHKVVTGIRGWQAVLSLARDKGYLIAGPSPDSQGGIALLKLDFQGQVLWQKVYYNHSVSLFALDFFSPPFLLIQTRDRDYVLVSGHNSALGLLSVLKLTADGQLKWAKRFQLVTGEDLPGNILASDVHETAEGGLILAASFRGQALLLALTADGQPVWQKLYDLPAPAYSPSRPLRVEKAPSGYYLVAGGASLVGTAGLLPFDWPLIKLSQEGEIEWKKVLNQKSGYFPGPLLDFHVLDNSELILSGEHGIARLSAEGTIADCALIQELPGTIPIQALPVRQDEILVGVQSGNVAVTDAPLAVWDAENPGQSLVFPICPKSQGFYSCRELKAAKGILGSSYYPILQADGEILLAYCETGAHWPFPPGSA